MNFDKAVADMVAPPKHPAPDREELERSLERFGFSRAIAGDAVFDKALDAITLARVEGRGLLITGGNGVGKTRLLRAVYETFYRREQPYHGPENLRQFHKPEYYHAATWVDCNDDRQLQWLTYDDMLGFNVFLDDFGSERMLYGDFDAVGAFICKWHARHKEGLRFHMATNLNSAQIDNRSGGRVLDRLVELCVAVRLDGNSKRKEMVVK